MRRLLSGKAFWLLLAPVLLLAQGLAPGREASASQSGGIGQPPPLSWALGRAAPGGGRGIASAGAGVGAGVGTESTRRSALVIGNSAYRHIPDLRNAVNDAEDMAAKLRGLGFEVALVTDADHPRMDRALEAFAARLRRDAGVGLVFYAGHGVQVAGRNYLLPVDMPDTDSPARLRYDAVPADMVVEMMEQGRGGEDVNIVLLDACRDNPFRIRSLAGGLASFESGGTVIAYAAGPGETAADGSGRNGLFTRHLLANLAAPGVNFNEMFRRVAKQVYQESGQRQRPWISGNFLTPYYFVPGSPEEAGSRQADRAVDPRHVTLPASVSGLSEDFKAQLREATAAYESGGEENLRRAREILKGLIPEAGASVAATDLTFGLLSRVGAGIGEIEQARAERERQEAERRRILAAERARRLAEERTRLEAEERQAEEARRRAEAEAARLRAEEELRRKQAQVETLLRKARLLHEAGEADGAREALRAARDLLPEDPGVTALAREIRIEPLPGEVWRDPTTGMEFVWVPEGCFQMGSTSGDNDERPVHQVCLDGFWLGKYEVTQGQWQSVMGSNPSHFQNGDNHPVEQVSWNDLQKFIQRLNRSGPGGYRLPTEAEWEYACRSGGRSETWSGGNDVGRAGWYFRNSGGRTHPVGGKAANGLGLYDMSGNVWEWVQDKYASNGYGSHASRNPIYEASGSRRVLRGGSWGYDARGLRCASRGHDDPGNRGGLLGARLARTP